MDTQTQIERLIELAIVQRGELRKLVGELPQLREHLNAEIERVFEETEPQLRVELEEFVAKQAQERTDAISAELKAKIDSFAKTLNQSAEAKYSALIAERAKNDDLLKQAEQNIAFAAQALPAQVKEIVTAELARFPRAGEIDQLRKEFAEPKGLNPRGKWSGAETYNRLDLVSYNGDSFVSNTDGNKEKPSRQSASWTLNAARGVGGAGGGVTSLTDLVPVPSNGQVLIGNGSGFVENTLSAGNGITITNGSGTITIAANGGVNYQGTWDANANSPTLTSSVGTKGFYYVVGVAGTTNLNGITDWQVGDWAIYNGTAWQKVDTTDQVSSVFGRTGAIAAVSTDYSAVGITNTAIGATNPSTGNFTSITTTGTIAPTGSLHAANGTAANPSIAFVNSQNTGLYRYAAGSIGIAASGTSVGNWDSSALNLGGNLTVAGTTGVTATDLKLGTSGPSAKSSIAARAARQGLVFDGTGNAATLSLPAFGTTDFSVFLTINASSLAANPYCIYGSTNAFGLRLLAAGQLRADKEGVGFVTQSTGTITVGKNYHIGYVRASGVGTYYIDGIAAGTATDTTDYSAGITSIRTGTVSSVIETPYVENRALSAAEVVSLYEAGVPSGADYATPAATNTSLSVNAWTNSSLPYSTFSGASATGFTAAQASATTAYAYSDPAFTVKAGTTIRVKFTATLTSGQAPLVRIDEIGVAARSANYSVSAGSNTIDIVATSGGSVRVIFLTTVAASYAISGLTATPLGLLLAPDAAQAGGGLTWYDTSGNAANITLPASGVTWNVPSSQKLGGNWTVGGNLTTGLGTTYVVSALNRGTTAQSGLMQWQTAGASNWSVGSGATGTNTNLEFYNHNTASTNLLLNYSTGNVLVGTTIDSGYTITARSTDASIAAISADTTAQVRLNAQSGIAILETVTNTPLRIRTNSTEAMRVFTNGNVFIGASPVDGGQKLQVAGNVQITNTGANGLVVTNTQGNALAVFNNSAADASGVNNGYFTIQTASSPRWYFGQSVSALNGDFQIYSVALGASVLSLAKSTGDATFAGSATIGTLSPGNNTAAHFLTGYAANQSWPARISAIYDASYVDTYVTLNGTLTGTRATPTFTGATTGGSYLRFNGANSEFVLGTYVGGAGAAAVPALTLKAGDATFAGNVAIQSGNALRLNNPSNSGYASIYMDASNIINFNYTAAFGVTIRTQGGTASTPASASATGVAGTIQWDANYIYVCTAANTWKRAAIATW